MSVDVAALVQLLREDPEQLTALRAVLDDGRADLQGALGRLAEAGDTTATALASLAVRVDELAQAQARTEARIEQLAQAQARTEARIEQLAQAQARTEARVDELAKDLRELARRQSETEQSLKALIDVVSGMNDRLGRLDGDALERRYRERGQAYLSQIAVRLRLVTGTELGVLVDDGVTSGRLTPREGDSLLLTDAVFTGLRHADRSRVHLAVEASVTLGRSDVRRARERADLLAKVVDTPVLAVVAGELLPSAVADAASDADVWRVVVGSATPPWEPTDD